jgi:hypothetical protein
MKRRVGGALRASLLLLLLLQIRTQPVAGSFLLQAMFCKVLHLGRSAANQKSENCVFSEMVSAENLERTAPTAQIPNAFGTVLLTRKGGGDCRERPKTGVTITDHAARIYMAYRGCAPSLTEHNDLWGWLGGSGA